MPVVTRLFPGQNVQSTAVKPRQAWELDFLKTDFIFILTGRPWLM